MTVVILKKSKDIDNVIARIHETGQTLQQDMHQAACSVIAHYALHKDKRVVLKLLHAMPEAARVNALREWMTAFSTFTVGEKDEITFNPNAKLQLAKAIEKPFWKFSPEKAYQPLKMDTYIADQIKKLRKDAEKTGRDHSLLIAMFQSATVPANLLPAKAPVTDPLALNA